MTNQLRRLDLPPLPPGLDKVFDVGPFEKVNLERDLKQTSRYIKILDQLSEQFLIKSNESFEDKISSKQFVECHTELLKKKRFPSITIIMNKDAQLFIAKSPEMNFMNKISKKIRYKKFIESKSIYVKLLSAVTYLKMSFEMHMQYGIPMHFKNKAFLNYQKNLFKSNKAYNTLNFKKFALMFKAQSLPITYFTKYPLYSIYQLQTSLEIASKKYISSIKYTPYTKFDDMLFCFLSNSDASIEIQQISLEITGLDARNKALINQKSNQNYVPSYERYNKFLKILINLLKINHQEAKRNTVSAALLRIIFDMSYVFNFDFISNTAKEFDINAQIVQKLSQNDLKIPNFFLPDDPDASINELINQIEEIKEISKKLEMLSFYSNPLDFAFIINDVVSDIKNRVKTIAIEKNHPIKFLDFDDLFLYFLAVFTYSPPRNSGWIAALLNKFSLLEISPVFQNSSIIFISAVEYIDKFSHEKFSPELKEKINKIIIEMN